MLVALNDIQPPHVLMCRNEVADYYDITRGVFRGGRTGAPHPPKVSKGIMHSRENHKNWCHQMSDFMAKMYQIQLRLGLCPRPRWVSLMQRFPRPSSWIKGPTSKGRGGKLD